MLAVIMAINCRSALLSKPGMIIAIKKQIEINALFILPDKEKQLLHKQSL